MEPEAHLFRKRIRKRRPEEWHLIDRGGCDRPPPPQLIQGIEELNTGRYWECHETLEAIWRDEPSDIRYLYQGILLTSVGMLHLTRGNTTGAVAKLERGSEMLKSFEPACMSVDVAALRRDVERVLRRIKEQGTGEGITPPVCHLMGDR